MTDDSEQERDPMGASPDPRAWSDEYLAMALEEFAEADFDHQIQDCLREAARRLRTGREGERACDYCNADERDESERVDPLKICQACRQDLYTEADREVAREVFGGAFSPTGGEKEPERYQCVGWQALVGRSTDPEYEDGEVVECYDTPSWSGLYRDRGEALEASGYGIVAPVYRAPVDLPEHWNVRDAAPDTEAERARKAVCTAARRLMHNLDKMHPNPSAVAAAKIELRDSLKRLASLSPTDGREGPECTCEYDSVKGIAGVQNCPVHGQSPAAPDTEGREAALVKASEFHEGPYTHLAHRGDTEAVCGAEVVAWGDEPDPDAAEPICAECLRQIPRPEEAGGEDEPTQEDARRYVESDEEEWSPGRTATLLDFWADNVDEKREETGDDGYGVMITPRMARWIADRLRRPPEGESYNGPEIPEGVLWSVAAAMDDAWHSGYQQARDDLCTGREERDDG